MNITELARLNPGDKPAIDTDYGQWLIDNHSEGWHSLDDLKAYMVDRGLTPFVDFIGADLGATLRAIHEITFNQCRLANDEFIARVADYITYLDAQSPIVSDSHHMLHGLTRVYGKTKVNNEIDRQFAAKKEA